MKIEFDTPARETEEWLLDHIRQKLIEMHHEYSQIVGAKVNLKRKAAAEDGAYSCEIDLTIFGSSIMVEYSAGSFAHAATETLVELEKRVQDQVHKLNEPPDEIVSSVDV